MLCFLLKKTCSYLSAGLIIHRTWCKMAAVCVVHGVGAGLAGKASADHSALSLYHRVPALLCREAEFLLFCGLEQRPRRVVSVESGCAAGASLSDSSSPSLLSSGFTNGNPELCEARWSSAMLHTVARCSAWPSEARDVCEAGAASAVPVSLWAGAARVSAQLWFPSPSSPDLS